MKIEPLIVVENVAKSSAFYQSVLDLESAHGGDEYEMLVANGNLVLQLHRRDAHEHPGMWDPDVRVGNGMILWFRTNDFDKVVSRVRETNARIVAEPHINPNAKQHEIWFRDPDGYLVVVADNIGDAS